MGAGKSRCHAETFQSIRELEEATLFALAFISNGIGVEKSFAHFECLNGSLDADPFWRPRLRFFLLWWRWERLRQGARHHDKQPHRQRPPLRPRYHPLNDTFSDTLIVRSCSPSIRSTSAAARGRRSTQSPSSSDASPRRSVCPVFSGSRRCLNRCCCYRISSRSPSGRRAC